MFETKLSYSAYGLTLDTFRRKKFENRSKMTDLWFEECEKPANWAIY